jgi:hypothetical protein
VGRWMIPIALAALAVGCASTNAEPNPPEQEPAVPEEVTPRPPRLEAALQALVEDPTLADALMAAIDAEATTLAAEIAVEPKPDRAELRRLLHDRVCDNLERKAVLLGPDGEPFPLSRDDALRRVVGYEAFKLGAYTSSGVFPKRYFGYFDRRWDTAAHEELMVEVVRGSTAVIRDWLADRGEPWTVNEMEIAVTWVSEGGALILASPTEAARPIHPVLGVGLDNIASGTDEMSDLVRRLDAELGTDLAGVVQWSVGADGGRDPSLARYMTFEESIVGTALMWVWEKKITQRKLLADGREGLQGRPIDEQFVLGSLVYNSGLVHDAGREKQILAFDGGQRLVDISDSNAHRRSRLNVAPPADALAELLSGAGYRRQPTSWLAVYHVLQRYGGYEAMRRFTDVFDEQGAFRERATPG